VEQVASSYQAFFGTSENAVKTPVWIAVSVYVLVAIVKKRLALSANLYEILQILSLTMFERTPLRSATSALRSPAHVIGRHQPVESLRITLGHDWDKNKR